MSYTKQKDYRSAKYLAWVRQQPCCICGAPADHAHHIIGTGNMGGMGTKAPDSMTMPVCVEHHRYIHDTPATWPGQWEHIARTLKAAIDVGFDFNK